AYRPGPFDPPDIPALRNMFGGVDLSAGTAEGRRVLRPCGLTDTPGGASAAGTGAAIPGLCLAVRPRGPAPRAGSAGLAFLGVAVVYFGQVRLTLVMLVLSLFVVWVFMTLQRHHAQAAQLAAGGGMALVGAMALAIRRFGPAVYERFASLSGKGEGVG